MLSPANLSIIQFIVFPVLLALLAVVSVRSLRVPRSFLAFALAGAACACCFAYIFPANPARAVVVAALEGDDFQSNSRVFREKVNSYLHDRGAVRAVGFHRALENYSEAKNVLVRDKLGMVVWGNSRWLNLSFPYTPALSIAEFGDGLAFTRLSKFQIVTSVPNVGLSFEPRNETADFIAGMAAALIPAVSATTPLDPSDSGARELTLMDAGNIFGRWTAGAHRALPWWVLGNLYTYRILRSEHLELGELRCAIAAYYRARSFLHPNDKINADLWSAVHNNLAVLLALQSEAENQPKLRKRARLFFRAASKIRHMPNLFDLEVRPGKVAKRNLHLLKGYVHKKAHAKKGKKSGKKHSNGT